MGRHHKKRWLAKAFASTVLPRNHQRRSSAPGDSALECINIDMAREAWCRAEGILSKVNLSDKDDILGLHTYRHLKRLRFFPVNFAKVTRHVQAHRVHSVRSECFLPCGSFLLSVSPLAQPPPPTRCADARFAGRAYREQDHGASFVS